jgi:hypothetical protein
MAQVMEHLPSKCPEFKPLYHQKKEKKPTRASCSPTRVLPEQAFSSFLTPHRPIPVHKYTSGLAHTSAPELLISSSLLHGFSLLEHFLICHFRVV